MIRVCRSCQTANRIPAERLDQTAHCGSCHAVISPVDSPIELGSEEDFNELVTHASLPVLVDFWAPWCGPCRRVAPEMAALAQEKAGKLVVAKVNTDELGALAQRYRVSAIPTMALFSGGAETDRESGAIPRAMIVKRFGL